MAECYFAIHIFYCCSSMTDASQMGDIESIESLLIDLSTLRTATDNFAENNKLGEGGFGAVYKVWALCCTIS